MGGVLGEALTASHGTRPEVALSDVFSWLVGMFGEPSPVIPVDEAQLDALSSALPPELLELWRSHGVGAWLSGKFQFCLPSEYASLTREIFEDDPDLAPASTHLVGFSAFGELLFWNEPHERVLVDLPHLSARLPAFDARAANDPGHYPLGIPLSRLDREGSFEIYEDADAAELLFEHALGRLGPPALGECFGFVPALRFGGSAKLDAIERVEALTYFSLIAGAGRCRLMVLPTVDEFEPVMLRYLGAG